MAIVCARIYYVAMAPFAYQSIWEMIDIRKGGIAIYGAVLGAFISVSYTHLDVYKRQDMSFTVPLGDAESAVAALKNATSRIGGGDVNVDKGCAKGSIVGGGMQSHSGVASTMFEALFNPVSYTHLR